MSKSFLKEPLLHFLVIGAALFLLYQWQRPTSRVMENEILVTSGDVSQMLSGFERTWQRPPTEQEFGHLIDNFVRDEIYYREAKGLGLDQDDIVVRRRLRQKLEFILEDVASQVEPSDEQLVEFMAKSPEKYMFEPRFSFHQVYLNPLARGEQLADDVAKLQVQLNSARADSLDPQSFSDPSLLPAQVQGWTRSAVESNFGKAFAEGVEGVVLKSWSGPINSPLGTHLVLLLDYQQGRMPELAEIREGVRNDWLVQRRNDYADQSYRELRQRYQVTIEPLEAARNELARNEREQ